MSILEFRLRFADDAACLDYLAMSRWPDGFRCLGCGGRRAWVLARRHLRECAACGRQTSVTAGTITDHTHFPLTLWFWPAYLMATRTPGISAVQLQRQLGISRHETAWFILRKLRRAMIAPERGLLAGEAEVDEAFAGGRNSGRRGDRDRTGKALVAVAVEVRGGGSGRIRLQALPNANGDTLPGFVQATIAPAAIVHTDGWNGYRYLRAAGYDHRPVSQHYRLADRKLILPRAHRAISSLKTWIGGTRGSTPARHLQVYLDEFTFRHNRRRTPTAVFQTLLGLSAHHAPATYREITT
jgi:transposase-like protein